MKDGSTPANSRNQATDPPEVGSIGGSETLRGDRGSVASRILALGALIAVALLVTVLLLGGDGGHKYKLLFQNGGQLVKGNEVLIGGSPAGTINDIRLTDDNQAEVAVTLDEPLHEGTEAVIRATSLSGVANHYVSVTPGPNNAPILEDGSTLTQESTTTSVDLDQLFNALDTRTRKGLRQVIQGFSDSYVGKGEEANRTYKYFAPSLNATDRLLRELNRDRGVLTDFIVNSSRVFTAVGERSDDLSGLISNTNQALGTIASQNEAFDRTLQVLPGTLRQANTTFVNLRAAFDDLDPLVNTSKVATRNLDPFLRKLRPVLHRAVPVFADLNDIVGLPGPGNDLAESVQALPDLEPRAAEAFPEAVNASRLTRPAFQFLRPYSPDVLNAVAKLGQVTAYYDANGHFARVQPANANLFDVNSGNLDPIPPSEQFDDLNFQIYRRCPGGATQAKPGSNPFLDNGNLGLAECDPSHVPPGP
ncbi:MAG: MlaD family protein [Solirubrobacterales bacterium]